MDYLPARLMKGSSVWYIIYYVQSPVTGVWKRERKTFKLNRIKNKRERLVMANRILEDLNQKLPSGWPWNEIDPNLQLKQTNILEALELATQIKCQSDRKATRTFYRSHQRSLIKFLEKRNLTKLSIVNFSSNQARAFLDYALIDRKVANSTYNIYIKAMKALFNELKERSYINENPFSNIKKKIAATKKRVPFTDNDIRLIANHAIKNDIFFYLSMNLLFYCFLRNAEQRRLKIRHIDLDKGVINAVSEISKTKKSKGITIPDTMMPLLEKMNLAQYPPSWYLFGEGFRPHPSVQCGRNAFTNKMRDIVQGFYKTGQMDDIEGKTFYSLKDSGAISLVVEGINMLDIRDQLRHSDLSTTQVYLEKFKNVSAEIKGQKKKL